MRTRLRVREVAQAKGISMTKLSQRSEVNYGTIKHLFRNPYAEVYVSTLTRIAQVLGVATAELQEDVSDEAAEVEIAALKNKGSSEIIVVGPFKQAVYNLSVNRKKLWIMYMTDG